MTDFNLILENESRRSSMEQVRKIYLYPDDTDIPALAAQIDEWKQTIPVTDTAKKKADADGGTRDAFAAQPATLTSIMQQILAFPIEKKSIMDCLSFLSDIKAQLARLV